MLWYMKITANYRTFIDNTYWKHTERFLLFIVYFSFFFRHNLSLKLCDCYLKRTRLYKYIQDRFLLHCIHILSNKDDASSLASFFRLLLRRDMGNIAVRGELSKLCGTLVRIIYIYWHLCS